jgi:hypothetical protein
LTLSASAIFFSGCEVVQTGDGEYAIYARGHHGANSTTSNASPASNRTEEYNAERELARSPFWQAPDQRGSWSCERLEDASSHMFASDSERKMQVIRMNAYNRGRKAGMHDKSRKAAYDPRGYPAITSSYDAQCMKNFLTGYNDGYTFYFPEGSPATPAP